MRVLLIEDDPLIGDGVRVALAMDGYAVDWVTDGKQGAAALVSESYTACVLDVGLPGIDGLKLVRQARDAGCTVPVLMLTARDTSADKIAGLDSGADDYLTKPFDLDELRARLRALIRRSAGQASAVLTYQDIVLDPALRKVTKERQPVSLSAREYAILYEFMMHPGRVRTKADIEDSLYGWGAEVESNAVEVHVHHLRKKLGQSVIKTIRNVGYVLGDA